MVTNRASGSDWTRIDGIRASNPRLSAAYVKGIINFSKKKKPLDFPSPQWARVKSTEGFRGKHMDGQLARTDPRRTTTPCILYRRNSRLTRPAHAPMRAVA